MVVLHLLYKGKNHTHKQHSTYTPSTVSLHILKTGDGGIHTPSKKLLFELPFFLTQDI